LLENPPFEDVFPIEHGDFFQCDLNFQGGVRIPVFQAPVEMFPKLGTVVFPKPI